MTMRRVVLAGGLILAACSGASSSVDIAVSGNEVKAEAPPSPPAETLASATPTSAPDSTPAPEGGPPATPAPAPVDKPADTPSDKPAPGHIALKYLMGDVDPANDPMFAKIPAKYIAGPRTYGHKDAVAAFVRMAEAAQANGYKLRIVSAFRSFSDQKQIWEDKWTGKTLVERGKLPQTVPNPEKRALKILEYSSMPGTSRHHWGTDFDLNSLNNSYFKTTEGKRTYDWLTQHAAEFGFCQTYTAKGEGRPTGYEEEKWHWSYIPVASWYLKQYPVDVGYERLTGFLGSDAAKGIDVIKNYVDGINPECRG